MSSDATGQVELSLAARRAARRELLRWWKSSGRQLPWRSSPTPYEVLVAEVLLQQTRFSKAEPAFLRIMALAPTANTLAAIPAYELSRIIRPLGLVKRAETLHLLGAALATEFGGVVPDNRRDLLRLPGVGHYIAGAVLCHGYNRPEPLVDNLTARFYQRFLGIAPVDRPARSRSLWAAVTQLQPRRPKEFHLAIVDLSSMVCRRVIPQCSNCPVTRWCKYANESHHLNRAPVQALTRAPC